MLKMSITNLGLDKIVSKRLIKYNLKTKILSFKTQPYCYIYRNKAYTLNAKMGLPV